MACAYGQAGDLFRLMSSAEKQAPIGNIAGGSNPSPATNFFN
jgi:hypothetical protein